MWDHRSHDAKKEGKDVLGIYELDGNKLKVACVVGQWKGKEWTGKPPPKANDPKEADVVMLYLLPSLNLKLIPQLEKLRPGSRIVSHAFDMRGVKPKQVVRVNGKDWIQRTTYLWTTPLEREK